MHSMTFVCWLLALAVAGTAAATADSADNADSTAEVAAHQVTLQNRQRRWVVFRPMFATRARQRAINRQARNQELRRLSRNRGQRHRRALHFPSAAGVDESGMALRVAVNDLLFQSAPANDLPEPGARGAAVLGGAAGAAAAGRPGAAGGRGGLRPLLLARLRSAGQVGHAREPAAEEEAFLLMSAAGGRPAIVPAPTSRPRQQEPPRRPHKKQSPSKHHKQRKTGALSGAAKQQPPRRRRVARDTRSTAGQRLDAHLAAMTGAAKATTGGIAERVKKYDAQGAYPAYSYTHGRFTRAAAPDATEDKPAVQVMKVKVRGDEDDEEMETAETIVFRPLFVHRDLQAAKQVAKQEAKRRRLGVPKKPTKPQRKPLRRRRPQPVTATPVRRPSASTTWFHRRTYMKYPPRYHYKPTAYRKVVYYH